MSSAPSTNSPSEHLPRSSSADSSAQDVLSADILIARLERLEVAVPRKERLEANFKTEATFSKHLVGLASKAVYSYCFEGEISLDSFKNWANIHWTRDRGLKLLSVRKISQFAFVTVFVSKADRDSTLSIEVASIRSSTAVHYTWTPECKNVNFRPPEAPTWVQLTGIPTWLKDSVPGIFKSIGPLLHLPLATQNLAAPTVGALILLNFTQDPLKEVTVDLSWLDGNIASPVYRGTDYEPASEDVLGGNVPPEGVNLNSSSANSERASDLETIPVAQPAAEVNQCQAEPEIVVAALDGTSSVGVSAGVLQGVDPMIQDLPTVSFPLRSSRLIHLARLRGASNHPVLLNLLLLVRPTPADCNEVTVSWRAKRPRVLEEDIPSGDTPP
ncbi:hypothetical protein R1flu_020716 [Riccia fluitans]|uniref:DUF4283 domain-containing protein n=1 Tax=Riccia fluitans TaxID=41844 RepID=A0ABD1ZMA7_9MARC